MEVLYIYYFYKDFIVIIVIGAVIMWITVPNTDGI